jgi:Protein of unknown function (DUF3667)
MNDQRRCAACGAEGSGRFCSECGAAMADAGAVVGRSLRDDAVDIIGFDRRLIATLRDLLIDPVRIVGAHMAGDRRRYLPPLRLFMALGGIYMVALSFVQPFRFDAPSLRRMGVREQDAVRIEQKLQQRGIPVEVFNERFESRMNTVVPVLTVLALLPLVPLLRAFDRGRAWTQHFLFILSASNGVWLYSLLLLPLALVSVRFHQVIIVFPLYVYLGVVFFAHYRAATRLRTTGRFAVFALTDFVVSIMLSTVLFAIVYLSVLLF